MFLLLRTGDKQHGQGKRRITAFLRLHTNDEYRLSTRRHQCTAQQQWQKYSHSLADGISSARFYHYLHPVVTITWSYFLTIISFTLQLVFIARFYLAIILVILIIVNDIMNSYYQYN